MFDFIEISPELIVFGAAMLAMMLVVVFSAAAELPGNRRLGSILNNDGNNILFASSGPEATPDEYREGVGHMLDAKPGVLAQSIGQPDPVFHRSNVATPWPKHRGEHWDAKAMSALMAAGTDPLQLTVEVCRQRGVPILASYRMNAEDLHDKELDSYDFGRENRRLRIADRNCLDPAHPEVYEHRTKLFAEVIENYDIDGLEFDYKRWIFMISNPSENHTILTRMVRETRQMLDEAAKRKGRKRLLLGVRVEPMISGELNNTEFPGAQNPPWNRSCEASGLDIRTWIDEDLIDYVCPSHFWPKWPGLPRTAEFVELAKDKDIGIYPTVWPQPAWFGDKDPPIEPDDTERMLRYKNDLCDLVLTCYDAGADGISTYNWLPHHQRGMLPKPMRPNWGDGDKGLQMHIHGLMSDRAAVVAYRNSDMILPSAQ